MDPAREGSREEEPERRPPRPPGVGTAIVVWAVLAAGVVGFLAYAASTTLEGPGSRDAVELLFWVALGLSATLVPASWLARAAVHGRARLADDRVEPRAWFTGHVLQWALCEGAALFGCVVTLLSEEKWPAAIPATVGLVGMLAGFPTGGDRAAD